MKTPSKTKKPSVSKTSAVAKASKAAPKLKKVDALAVADVVIGLDTFGRVTYSTNTLAPVLDGELAVRPGAVVTFSCHIGALAVGLLPVKTEGPRIEFRVGSAPTGGRISFEVPKEAKTSLYKYTFTIFFDNSKPKTNIGSAMTVDPRFRVLL
jgi:hypothetical protein